MVDSVPEDAVELDEAGIEAEAACGSGVVAATAVIATGSPAPPSRRRGAHRNVVRNHVCSPLSAMTLDGTHASSYGDTSGPAPTASRSTRRPPGLAWPRQTFPVRS